MASSRLLLVVCCACLLGVLAPAPAHADDDPEYDLLFFGYQAFSTSVTAAEDSEGQSQNVPTLWGVGFYENWYYKANWGYGLASLFDFLSIGSTAQFGKDDVVYRQSAWLILSDFEVGPTWRLGPGLIGVGPSVDIISMGRGRINLTDGNLIGGQGGTALDFGLALNYTLPLAGFLRLNPSFTGSISTLAGVNDYDFTGSSYNTDVTLIARLLDWFSVQATVGHDIRSYSPAEKSTATEDLKISSSYLWLGVAFHDDFGIGTNEF